MQSKDLIKMMLETNMGLTIPLIEDMKDAPLTSPTPAGGNHPLWVLGHLAYAEGSIIREMMLGEPNPLADWKSIFSGSSQPVNDASTYPPFDEVMNACLKIHVESVAILDALSEEELDTPARNVPEEYKPFFGTYRQCFAMMAGHWLMHRGQVADARRAAGRDVLIA